MVSFSICFDMASDCARDSSFCVLRRCQSCLWLFSTAKFVFCTLAISSLSLASSSPSSSFIASSLSKAEAAPPSSSSFALSRSPCANFACTRVAVVTDAISVMTLIES